MKLIDAIQDAVAQNRQFFGIEFFPPKTEAGVVNLYARMERMASLGPLFCGMTWGDLGSTANETIEISATAHNLYGMEMQVHMTAAGATKSDVCRWVNQIKARHIDNVFALSGTKKSAVSRATTQEFSSAKRDTSPTSNPQSHFPSVVPEEELSTAAELVRTIRAQFPSIGITVSGYPEGHPDDELDLCGSEEERQKRFMESLHHLKAKVDAGADVIVTQMVFDAQTFIDYCKACRQIGITCPIIPGIMPIQSYTQFRRFQQQAFKGMDELAKIFEPAKNDDAEIRRLGVQFTTKLVKRLLRSGVRGVYFFTMNMESVVQSVLEELGLLHSSQARDMPWKSSGDKARRDQEHVRPLHWSIRSKSYLAMTEKWDEFPNGRWGSTQAPSFREDTTYHTQLALSATARSCSRLHGVRSIGDVCGAFIAFLHRHGRLPWCDEGMQPEANLLLDGFLDPLNRRGLLSINSQPAVNAAPSAHPLVGWGPSNGYVFQKQYVEFFCGPEVLDTVLAAFAAHPSLTYMAQDASGSVLKTNVDPNSKVNAVTWGVFPQSEIVQPTIVSTESFKTWVPEAFDLWRAPFVGIAGTTTNSSSSSTTPLNSPTTLKSKDNLPVPIQEIVDSWILVNVVDNDFVTSPCPMQQAGQRLIEVLPELYVGGVSGAAKVRGEE